jgi:hypothetical protein
METEVKKNLSEMSRKEIRKTLKDDLFKGVTKKPLTPEEFKMYVNQLFYVDKIQTTFQNQRRSAEVNNIIKNDPLFPEIEQMRREENNESEKLKTKRAKLEKEALINQINLKLERDGESKRVDEKTVDSHINQLVEYAYDVDVSAQLFELFEVDRIKDVTEYMENNLPVYQWCKQVKGLGPKMAAKILGGIGDIRRFPNPSNLWSYCGVGDATKSKRVAGQKLNYSSQMRATLYVLSESFVKLKSQYRVVYDKRKEKTLQTHPEWHNLIPCPQKNVGSKAPKTDKKGNVTWANQHPKHAHVDAQRVMIKRFLAELFAAWYYSLGIEPPSKPYGVEIEGHHEEEMIVPYRRNVLIVDKN